MPALDGPWIATPPARDDGPPRDGHAVNRLSLATNRQAQIVTHTLALLRAASPNPPGDTRAAAEVAASLLRAVPGAEVTLHATSDTVTNLVARIHGAGPSHHPVRRVVLNGHLDTYPVGDLSAWTTNPAGELRDDRLYGRGSADMKGGIAAAIAAFTALAEIPGSWHGELVLTLAGDEETMGPLGTRWLLDNVPHASGNAVLIPDAGSPRVVRFGEKGFLWLELEARGRAAHGAHVHLGENALERLMDALFSVRALTGLAVDAPETVRAAIGASKTISEPLAGPGEAAVLGAVTVNVGRLEGGTSTNLVPDVARAGVDIRLPVGTSCAAVEAALATALVRPGLSYTVQRRFEPNHTDPASTLIRTVAAAAREVTGEDVAVNMRVGGSDARWFRMAGLPTVVYGPTPHGMGGPDEWVSVAELDQVARVLALTAFDLLQEPA